MSSYAEYYQRALDRGINGYKPVAGGTGLGKTLGVVACIKGNKGTHKFIYVSHRHNLLEQMAIELEKEHVKYRYVKSDTEIVRSILKEEDKLALIKALIKNPIIKEYARYARKNISDAWKYEEKNCLNQVLEARKIINLEKSNQESELDPLNPADEFNKKAAIIFGFFKRIFFECAEVERILKSEDTSQISGFKFNFDDVEILKSENPVIYELFPYWEYNSSENIPVLLTTIHKLFSGFFDGKQNINIHKEKDKVLFLDEFEFLEPVLLDKIIEESKLNNPFIFIAYFYHNMGVKLLDDNYLSNYSSVRKRLKKIEDNILRLRDKSLFPHIRSFGIKDEKVIRRIIGSGLYQGNYTSIERPIFLEIDDDLRRYWLVEEPQKESFTTFHLIKSIKRITNEILQFYMVLKTENEKLYHELVEDAYEKTEYISYLNKLSFFSVIPTRKGNKSHQVNNFTYLYHRGYGVYVLNKPKTQAEPNEVFLDFYMVNTSPERCLLGLIQKNLVFGLSATAHIQRYLERFDEDWLKREIQFEADDNVEFMELDHFDKKIIDTLTQKKAKKRGNTLKVSIANESCNESIKQLIGKLKGDRQIIDVASSHDYHTDRLFYFFNTLDWMVKNPNKKKSTVDSHLLFFNSIKQIKVCLELLNKGIDHSAEITVENKGAFHFDINYRDTSLSIILFDSNAHKYYFESESGIEKYRNLFNTGKVVVLVTQYPSANNGVNLQYINSSTGELISEDYQNIHLLEAPHFYFSHGTNRSEEDKKKDIWQLSKLVSAGKITKSEFNLFIKKIMTGSNDLNTEYKKTNDYILNQIAKIIQALGRVERTWGHTGLQRGRISKPVLQIFNRYFYNKEIQKTVADSSQYFSSFIRLFFSQVSSYATKPQWDKNDNERPSDIIEEDKLFSDVFRGKLNLIKSIQKGQIDKHTAHSFINDWNELRRSALDFDLNSTRIREVHGTFFSEHIYNSSGISWRSDTGKIKSYVDGKYDENFRQWGFYTPYRKLLNVDEVKTHFSNQGYPLEFQDYQNFKFFTPSFYQQVYLGALGEEASKAMFRVREEPIKLMKPEELAVELFEVIDFVVPSLGWFVDAKFYAEQNMLGLKQEGQLSNKIKGGAKSKITTIRKYRPEGKLVIVNANSDLNGYTSYYDIDFNIVDKEKPEVIVFPGLIQLREYLDEN